MRRLAQSTSVVVTFKAFLSSDHVSAATGKTIAVVISKNGGAFGNPNAGATNATEISNGWYKVTLDTTDTNTLGDLIVRGTEGTIDPTEQVCLIVSATTGGATNLDAAISSRLASVGYTAPDNVGITAIGIKTSGLTFTTAGILDSNVVNWKNATAAAMTGDAYAALTGSQAEPGQGAPAVNASPLAKVSYLYKAWRNKITQTSSEYKLFADDASTVDQKASISDDGTTFTRNEVAGGP